MFQYVDHLEGECERLYPFACDKDLEGIVAKMKTGQYGLVNGDAQRVGRSFPYSD